jgi:hypothetical protein
VAVEPFHKMAHEWMYSCQLDKLPKHPPGGWYGWAER